MTCSEARGWLEAHADGELDLLRQVELEEHLRVCPECARQAAGLAARREALREGLPRYAAPPHLRAQILANLETAAAPARVGRPAWFGWPLGGLAAGLVLGVSLGSWWANDRAHADTLWHEAVADHVRSLQAGHLMDVVSTDQHTVKPWFAGKLDFAPPVVDLAGGGFPLAGGRLERLDGQTAAALVFHRRLHSINLFIWPNGRGAVGSGRSEEHGYAAQSWSAGDLNFLAVSDIPPADLDQFVAAYRHQVD